MELYLDTGNIEEIQYMVNILEVEGVTTNPTIVSKSGKEFTALIKEISEIIGDDKAIHAQVLSRDWEGMVKEGKFIDKLHKNIYVKIPVTAEGLKAIKELSKVGIKTTATAVFTAHQGTLAAKAGARYIAPYVNRLDNISADGVKVVKQLVNIMEKHNFESKVLAASFKNAQQVIEIIEHGVHSVTVPTEVLRAMTKHPLTDYSVDKFISDWEDAYGVGTKTTL